MQVLHLPFGLYGLFKAFADALEHFGDVDVLGAFGEAGAALYAF